MRTRPNHISFYVNIVKLYYRTGFTARNAKLPELSNLFEHLKETYYMYKVLYNPDVDIYDFLIRCE